MTAETSNARWETYTFDMIEDAWGDAVPLTKPYFDRFRARLETLRQQSAAPPPPAEAQACDCGEATCVEPWEPGCGLGSSVDHAVVAPESPREIAAEAQAQGGGRAHLAQQPAAVGGDFINRIADSLIAKGWDIDPNCDGTGVVQLREAVISAIAQQPAAVNEAAAIRAFEEHFEASSDDPYFEGELELWLTAWRKALAAQRGGRADG